MRPVGAIEVCGAFSGELEMLPLVIADWDVSGPVNQYVGCLEDRVREESKLQLRSYGLVEFPSLIVHL